MEERLLQGHALKRTVLRLDPVIGLPFSLVFSVIDPVFVVARCVAPQTKVQDGCASCAAVRRYNAGSASRFPQPIQSRAPLKIAAK